MSQREKNQCSIPREIEALLSLLDCTAITNAAVRVPPDLWLLSETELRSKVEPSDKVIRFREVFWREVGKDNRRFGIKVSRIAEKAGISYDYAYELLTKNPILLAWLLKPMESVYYGIDPLLDDLMRKLCNIARLPLMDQRGRTIAKNAKLIIQTVEVLAPLLIK